jgi:hypothetical protein
VQETDRPTIALALKSMETDSPSTAEKPRKLRWYQWRLRSMFLLMLLVAIGMSYVAVEMRNQRKQNVAARQIENMGGKVQSEPTWLGTLLRDDSLVKVTDASLAGHLASEKMVYLDPGGKFIIADALWPFEELSQLRTADFRHVPLTDNSLVYLQGLSQLQVLDLDCTNITDAGLVHLQGLSQLQLLSLSYTKVTDAGLVHLQGLNRLQKLWLGNTKVTAKGAKKLRQALPNCAITTK